MRSYWRALHFKRIKLLRNIRKKQQELDDSFFALYAFNVDECDSRRDLLYAPTPNPIESEAIWPMEGI
jgi:hypothetical protein